VKQVPPMHAEQARTLVTKGVPAIRSVAAPQRFQAGQRVRARNINPTGHTRLPRYARGKIGTIDRDHGVYVFPDTNAHFQGENPQRVYSVRFVARELWGEQASPRDSVYIDMWDTYLEPA
jgi:nitrile hydratase beta subunit